MTRMPKQTSVNPTPNDPTRPFTDESVNQLVKAYADTELEDGPTFDLSEEVLRTYAGDVSVWQAAQEHSKEIRAVVTSFKEKLVTGGGLAMDLFNALRHLNPRKKEVLPPSRAVHERVVDDIMSTKEFLKLRRLVDCEDEAAAMATIVMRDKVLEAIPADAKKDQQEAKDAEDKAGYLQGMLELLNEAGKGGTKRAARTTKELQEAQKQAQEAGQRCQQKVSAQASQIRGTLRQGLKAAIKDAKEADAAASALGWGTGPGQRTSTNPKDRLEVSRMLRAAPRLKKAAQLIGRMRGAAFSAQTKKLRQGITSYAAVTRGNHLARVLPGELAQSVHPQLKLLFLRKYATRKLQEYQPKTNKKQIQGPMVVLLDVSGSMWGERSEWAMALILALQWIGQKQKRAFYVIAFTTQVEKTWDLSTAGPKQVIQFAMHAYDSGGTDFDVPMAAGLKKICEGNKFEKADLVFVTDGECYLKGAAEYKKTMDERAIHMYTFYVQAPGSQQLDDLSTKSQHVENLTSTEEAGNVFAAL